MSSKTEVCKALVIEGNKSDTLMRSNMWSIDNLKNLSNDELLDWLQKIDNQATLMSWNIWWTIRQRFRSDKLFGQYIAEFKEHPVFARLVGKSQSIHRAWNAGRFCELYNITDLDAVGLQKTAVYSLSRPVNVDIAGRVFHAAKGKNLPIKEIERMIYEAKSITVMKYHNDGEPDDDTEESEDYDSNLIDKGPEKNLYPKLIEYLKFEFQLYCMQIDDKKRIGAQTKGRNHWLYPDVVAMEVIGKDLDKLIKEISGQRSCLWSFEVKIELDISNVRKSFFQSVSNSSWANKGYLVAAHIDDNVKQELKMLSELHGIGVILLDSKNPRKSIMLYPAPLRKEPDWMSMNRLKRENKEFEKYVEEFNFYKTTGEVRNLNWA